MKIFDQGTPRRLVTLFASLVVLFWLSVKLLESYRERVDKQQTQIIVASYYREAAAGGVPMPADTNEIRVLRKEPGAPPLKLLVKTGSGETNWFDLTRPADGSETNWGFRPR